MFHHVSWFQHGLKEHFETNQGVSNFNLRLQNCGTLWSLGWAICGMRSLSGDRFRVSTQMSSCERSASYAEFWHSSAICKTCRSAKWFAS